MRPLAPVARSPAPWRCLSDERGREPRQSPAEQRGRLWRWPRSVRDGDEGGGDDLRSYEKGRVSSGGPLRRRICASFTLKCMFPVRLCQKAETILSEVTIARAVHHHGILVRTSTLLSAITNAGRMSLPLEHFTASRVLQDPSFAPQFFVQQTIFPDAAVDV